MGANRGRRVAIVGGGIANTFLRANGAEIGKSLCENDMLDTARRIMAAAQARGAAVPLLQDAVCGKEFSETAVATTKPVAAIEAGLLAWRPALVSSCAMAFAYTVSFTTMGSSGTFLYYQF